MFLVLSYVSMVRLSAGAARTKQICPCLNWESKSNKIFAVAPWLKNTPKMQSFLISMVILMFEIFDEIAKTAGKAGLLII